ncbi:MAG: hypothetical protein KTR24_07860 [Saprospiraceae bacterium]|nr:hypothetical protein [Saprospiraceae bacterium]
MKAVLSWSLMAIFLSSASLSYAGDTPSRALLISKLKDKVSKLIDSRELKTISCDAETVRIEFKIDDEGRIQVRETSTENAALEHYIFARLDEQHHHQRLSGEKFVIDIDFKASR